LRNFDIEENMITGTVVGSHVKLCLRDTGRGEIGTRKATTKMTHYQMVVSACELYQVVAPA